MNRIRAAARRVPTLAAALLLFVLIGCGEPYSPGKNLQITNELGLFRFQVSDMQNYDQTLSFTWTNSSTTGALVDQYGTITGGDATLVLKDASGATVYARSLKQKGEFATSYGTAGPWTVQILMTKVTGSVIFQVVPN